MAALRQVLSLLIAQRRPSYYLGAGREEMAALTDSHIRLLANGGIIDTALRDAALSQRVVAQNPNRDAAIQPVEATKGITVARMRLPVCSACRCMTWTGWTSPPVRRCRVICRARSANIWCAWPIRPSPSRSVCSATACSPEKTGDVR